MDGVFNVQKYDSIQTAADEVARRRGGILYFPPGVYPVSDAIKIASRTTILGVGPASYIKRDGGTDPATGEPRRPRSSTVFQCLGVQDVIFRDVAIDLNWDAGLPAIRQPDDPRVMEQWNFRTGVQFGSLGTGDSTVLSDNCIVERVYFTSGPRPIGRQTHLAVLANNARHLRVSNCRIVGLEVKAAGPGGPTRGPVTIIGNHFSDPYNYAIAYVGKHSDDRLENLIVAQNTIENVPASGGIYVGTDSDQNQIKSLNNVLISANQIVGSWGSDAVYGILVRLAAETMNVCISDNVVVNSGSTRPERARGISVKRPDPGISSLHGCRVTGNIIDNVWLEGIRILGGPVERVQVHGNQLRSTRGLSVEANRDSSDWTIADNCLTGNRGGIRIEVASGTVRGVELHGNICRDNGEAGIEIRVNDDAFIQGRIHGNKCYGTGNPLGQQIGLKLVGPSSVDVRECDNDLRDNAVAPIRGAIATCSDGPSSPS